MIQLKSVSKTYDSRKILDHIDLVFPAEQTHVLLGSSGSGKSTLLRLIMGLVWPDLGDVLVKGERMTPLSQRRLVLKMGYVIQDGGLFPHLTGEENVVLMARVTGWSSERIRSRFSDLSELVELAPQIMKRFPHEMSGGQRQRVGLMRALMLDPALLLLDEPLGALDPIVRASLQTQLKSIFTPLKKTVIIVTHDIGEAAYFGHTVALLNEGRVVQQGSFGDLARNPKDPFVTEFIRTQRPPDELREFL